MSLTVEKTEIETFFGRCRCCLSYGYLKNMWSEHQYEGESEIYGEMLVQCFALSWNHTEESIEQDQICEQCICRLRDATDFKKIVLDSQQELMHQIDAENSAAVKEEVLDEEFLIEFSPESDQDTADTNYTADTTDYPDTADNGNTQIKDEMEYEEIEYLEEDENGEAVEERVDTDSSLPVDAVMPVKRRKKQFQKEDSDDEAPKRKWPKRLPKSERLKTYKQYTEETLRQCMEAVRNNELTPNEASRKFNIPKKTICAKIKMDPNDVHIDSTKKSTNKHKLEQGKTKLRSLLTIFKKTPLDKKTKRLIEMKKAKAQNLKQYISKTVKADDVCLSKTDAVIVKVNIGAENDKTEAPVSADQIRKRYKAIVNKKFHKTKEPEKPEINEIIKHKHNIKTILHNSNATIIKGFWGVGYSCLFCDEQRELPSELKQHNLEAHSDAGDDVIKVKYVSDLIIRLDITDLKCKLCGDSLQSLEDILQHLSIIHAKIIHTDIKNHIIPFKFDTDSLQCVMCKKQFKFFKLLSEHMSEHYRNYECPSCERAFINKQSMQTHSYRHKRGVFKCTHCPKVFDSRPKRSVHERIVHALSNKTRKCSYCDERFSTKDMVQSHEVKVHGIQPTVFSCQACNKSYNSQSSLITHKNRFHLMLRPHKCSYCDMAFFSKIELRSHTVTHTKSRDFVCEICNKSFGTRCRLNQHVKVHSDDRRFKCDTCERAFLHRTAFRVHMRTKHGRIV